MRISDWSSDVCSSDLVLLHDVAVGLVAVGAEAEARLLQRVADIEVGPAKLVVAKLEPETEQAVDDDAVVGDDAVEIGLRLARQVGFEQIGRAHVCTPVTNATLVCRLLIDKKKTKEDNNRLQVSIRHR